MKWFRFLLGAILAILMLLIGALLAVQNSDEVPLDLIFIVFPPRSVALWVLIALGLGAVLGMLVSGLLTLRLRTRLLKVRRELSEAQIEVNQLRRTGLITDE